MENLCDSANNGGEGTYDVLYLTTLPIARQLQLPRCGGQRTCALPLRTLAPWPRTSLPLLQRNSLCEKWHPPECFFYKSTSGCRFGETCSYAYRQVDEQPSKRSKKNGDKSAVAMLKKHELFDRTGRPVVYDSSNTPQFGCVFQDVEPPKSPSILRKVSDIGKPIRRVKFTKAVARHTYIRDQNPSLGMICPGEPHQRSPNAPKFEDRTEWQEQGACEAAWNLANKISKLMRKRKLHSSHLRKIGAYWHQILNLRNENLLSTPVRQCT